jgi:signal transduction histidine kinase
MKPYRPSWRIGLLGLMLFALGLILGWAAFSMLVLNFWSRIQRIPIEFERVQVQYKLIAKKVTPTVTDLNRKLTRTIITKNTNDADSFRTASNEFQDWIVTQKLTAPSGRVQSFQPFPFDANVPGLLEDMEKAHKDYRTSAEAAIRGSASSDQLGNLNHAFTHSQELLQLANQANTEGQALGLFIAGSATWLPTVQRLIFVALLLLLTIGIALAILFSRWIIQHRVINPLRSQLDESQTIIERQEKLAHFGEVASGLAHEIRNPLTAINARLFTLDRTLPESSPQAADAAVIRKEIKRLDRILTNFLKVARPPDPEIQIVTAHPLFTEVADLTGPEYAPKQIKLVIGETVETPFLADPQQIKQVLINLIRNAADSIASSGTITLRALDAKLRHRKSSEPAVTLEVHDTGPGIPAEIQPRLFDPFFSTKETGTGLGLPISARIVDKHGGTLEFTTSKHSGTIFRITLPAPSQVKP